ncbi:MAG: methyl-accepting chemotaxis protein [Spirochaetes bacterium]|nr:methyl-accepting chemotaxis protein [Spirochaetota bacterium]
MKIRYKLSIIMAVSIILIVSVGATTQTVRTMALSRQLSVGTLVQMGAYWMEFWHGRVAAQYRVLHTLADIMGDFENLPQAMRRDTFDEMKHSTVAASPEFFGINVLWLPNVLDLDEANIDRVGSTPTGQFGSAFIRELPGGQIEHRTLISVDEMNAHILSPQARNDLAEHPHMRIVPGRGEVWLVSISVPIINSVNNQVVGVLSAHLDIAFFQAEIQPFLAAHPEVALVGLYAGNGHIMAATNPGVLNTNLSGSHVLFGDLLPQMISAMHGGTDLQTGFFSPGLGGNAEIVLNSLPLGVNSGMTWSVLLVKTDAVMMAPINAIVREVGILVVLLSILVIVAFIVFFGRATKPLVWLQREIGVLADGDFRDVEMLQYKGDDEIGDLVKSFEGTQKSVCALIKKVKGEAQDLYEIGETLSSNMSQTAATVNEITANIQNVKGRVVNQSASVNQTSATMKQLVQNIDKLDGFIGDQSGYVATASSAVEQMAANIRSVTDTLIKNSANVKNLMEASEVGRTGINEVASDIQEISRESEGLMEINAVMENIASQTNLLSMNAAIEAAHAGEAGKGFAVVADEIRKLAESSKEQSKIIGTVLKKIKASIDKITHSNEDVLNKFEDIEAGIRVVSEQEDNIRSAMEEQDVGSRQIVKGILEITEITHKVKTGSNEMLQGANEVIKETGNLEGATREISDSMNEMVSGADQINVAVNQVNDISGQNRHAIDTLVKEVSFFIVD